MPLIHPIYDLTLTSHELALIQGWFELVQDFHEISLETDDYELAKQIYEKRGLRVPHRILEKVKG